LCPSMGSTGDISASWPEQQILSFRYSIMRSRGSHAFLELHCLK